MSINISERLLKLKGAHIESAKRIYNLDKRIDTPGRRID